MKHSSKHGLRHHGIFVTRCGTRFACNTLRDDTWVYASAESLGLEVRMAKVPGSRVYRQGMNPDYDGYLPYTVEIRTAKTLNQWEVYTSSAEAGDIKSLCGDLVSRGYGVTF